MMPPNIKAEVQWRYKDDLLISVALLEPHTLMMLSRSITLISKQGKSSLLLLSPFSCVQLCATPQMTPTRLPHPWDFPGKNTGVCCHFPLQCMKVKSESEVAQSCLTLSYPMDCSPPGTSVHGIFQARVLKWVAIAFSQEQLRKLKFPAG